MIISYHLPAKTTVIRMTREKWIRLIGLMVWQLIATVKQSNVLIGCRMLSARSQPSPRLYTEVIPTVHTVVDPEHWSGLWSIRSWSVVA